MTPGIDPPQNHEFELAKQLADAVVEAGVNHLVFSSLKNIDKTTDEKNFVPHFTNKARVEEYIRTLTIRSTFIYIALLYEPHGILHPLSARR